MADEKEGQGIEMQMEAPKKKPNTVLLVILSIILAAVVFGAGGYWLGKNKSGDNCPLANRCSIDLLTATAIATATSTVTDSTSSTGTADVTANWTSYANTKYGYSFKYPATVKLTASRENSDDLAINATADGVNVFPSTGTVGNGIFFVAVPNIDFTITAIKNQFSATKAENIAPTSMTIAGANSYKVVISGDNSVVSTFYFIKSPSGTVLELTVLNSSSDAQSILASFQFTPVK